MWTGISTLRQLAARRVWSCVRMTAGRIKQLGPVEEKQLGSHMEPQDDTPDC